MPDVAYLSNECKARLSGELRFVVPDVVIEILFTDDRADRVASKRDTYLAAGVRLVVVVDADARAIDKYHAAGHPTHAIGSISTSAHFPGFVVDVAALVAEIDD